MSWPGSSTQSHSSYLSGITQCYLSYCILFSSYPYLSHFVIEFILPLSYLLMDWVSASKFPISLSFSSLLNFTPILWLRDDGAHWGLGGTSIHRLLRRFRNTYLLSTHKMFFKGYHLDNLGIIFFGMVKSTLMTLQRPPILDQIQRHESTVKKTSQKLLRSLI